MKNVRAMAMGHHVALIDNYDSGNWSILKTWKSRDGVVDRVKKYAAQHGLNVVNLTVHRGRECFST